MYSNNVSVMRLNTMYILCYRAFFIFDIVTKCICECVC